MRHRPVILIVEDEPELRELYRLALTLSNHNVHCCEDGLEALQFLETDRPDLVVLDLNLPRVPGRVLYDELRASARLRRIPVLVVTGMEPAPQLPGTTLLIKPVPGDELVRVVDEQLGLTRGSPRPA
jgi:DNA-binding response OmpR family regulator